MNQFNELLLKRHSIRKYTDQPVDADQVRLILEAGLLAPSSKSSRPWQFVVVEDRDTLQQLAQCKPAGARPIAGAAFAVVVTADPEKSDVFIEDASVAASFMQLQAAQLGLGSCWIQVRSRFSADDRPAEEIVQQILNIPPSMPVVMILTFGHINEERRPVDPSKLLWEKVHIGTWAEKQ